MRCQSTCFFATLAIFSLVPLLLLSGEHWLPRPATESQSWATPLPSIETAPQPRQPPNQPNREGFALPTESWVVLLSLQRSGTHWLSHELNRDPCIAVLPEILYHQTERFSWWTPTLRREAIQGFFKGKLLDPTAEFDGKQLPWTLVDYVAQTGKDLQNGRLVRGFNWKVNQAFPEDWSSWFKKYCLQHKIRIVFLQRRNDLRRIFSVEANRKVPLYATKDAGEATKVRKEKVELDPKNLTYLLQRDKQKIQQVRQILGQARAMGLPVLHVYYEDLAGSAANLEAVRNFLRQNSSCPPAPLSKAPGWVKLHNGSLSHLIGNWNEVKKSLEATQWEWMLND